MLFRSDKIKLSHMFKYPPKGKRKKVYYAYNTVEITTLPDGAEAFPYTSFQELGNMPFTKEVADMVRGIGGEEMLHRAESLHDKSIQETGEKDAAGIASKTHDNFEGSTIPEDDEIKALMTSTKDMNTRLESVEKILGSLSGLEAAIKALTDKIGRAHV